MSDRPAAMPLQAFADALADLVAGAASRVVVVQAPRARLSGFLWKPGLVVTADEALGEDGPFGVVMPGGAASEATLVGRDAATDIALLRVAGGEVTSLADAAGAARAGALAVVVGAQAGAPVVALGVVAQAGGAWRSLRGGEIAARIELDVHLRREGEGGLVLDAAGRPLGMAVFGARRRVLVIPAATIAQVVARLETHGRIARGYLGLGLHAVRVDGEARGGVMVMSVDARGPGAAAGMAQGDVIVGWDGVPVHGVRDLMWALAPDSVGRAVTVKVRRGGVACDMPLVVGERPQG